MQETECCGVLSYIVGSVFLCVFMLLCGYFLGGRSYSRFKNVPFESGIKSVGDARARFSVKFYLIAMIFVIFDVEGIYLYIWSVSIQETGWIGFIEVCIFVFILLISLIYATYVGVFNWKNRLNEYSRVDSLYIGRSKFFKNDK
ncbi:NADH dehydrogenase I chain A [Candidatus Blochmanniella floridana]|uniref:NADH-quinone oxidoreductase subunit A n=1 Tax=Blochmanniella floridana TaxID=203907 RepID=NUOA_BLOFL|nr:RecName: Full=NADH-quinone oxidoreductase subunit A; AltName: Full=NADH dehydrogenase I subunit A; AltName: Full=NDH-1 subunit A; AltName: Full=NUO1 [Candidatus Blochmannia floridanus]CAD83182.1 NADH dehydrogenase I chain A [Candidatus Blochmannia floridanus]